LEIPAYACPPAGRWIVKRAIIIFPNSHIKELTNGDHSHKFKTKVESKSVEKGTAPGFEGQEKLYGD
jgi:hypothetical protein